MTKKIDYSKHTKDELVQIIEDLKDDKDVNKELFANLNSLLSRISEGNIGSTPPPTKKEDDTVLLMWQGSSLVPVIEDKHTREIIVAFDKTFEVRPVPASKIRTLINQHRRLFKDGLLVFVNEEDAEKEFFSDIPKINEDKILNLLEMDREKMIEEIRNMSSGVQRTILWHCAKKVQDEDPLYTKYAYDKIQYMARKIGNTDLNIITSTLAFVRED